MNQQQEINKKQNFIVQFYNRHPTLAVLAAIASIIGAIWSIYTHFLSGEHSELVYMVNPTRTVLVHKDKPSDITVLFKGKPINETVCGVQISIWNKGKMEIRGGSVEQRGDITSPIKIKIHKTKILEVDFIKNPESSITGLKYHEEDKSFEKGEIPLSWKVLQNRQGVKLQIIYAGSPDAEVKLNGSILNTKEKYRKPQEYSAEKRRVLLLLLVFVIEILLVSLTLLFLFPPERLSFKNLSSERLSFFFKNLKEIITANLKYKSTEEYIKRLEDLKKDIKRSLGEYDDPKKYLENRVEIKNKIIRKRRIILFLIILMIVILVIIFLVLALNKPPF